MDEVLKTYWGLNQCRNECCSFYTTFKLQGIVFSMYSCCVDYYKGFYGGPFAKSLISKDNQMPLNLECPFEVDSRWVTLVVLCTQIKHVLNSLRLVTQFISPFEPFSLFDLFRSHLDLPDELPQLMDYWCMKPEDFMIPPTCLPIIFNTDTLALILYDCPFLNVSSPRIAEAHRWLGLSADDALAQLHTALSIGAVDVIVKIFLPNPDIAMAALLAVMIRYGHGDATMCHVVNYLTYCYKLMKQNSKSNFQLQNPIAFNNSVFILDQICFSNSQSDIRMKNESIFTTGLSSNFSSSDLSSSLPLPPKFEASSGLKEGANLYFSPRTAYGSLPPSTSTSIDKMTFKASFFTLQPIRLKNPSANRSLLRCNQSHYFRSSSLLDLAALPSNLPPPSQLLRLSSQLETALQFRRLQNDDNIEEENDNSDNGNFSEVVKEQKLSGSSSKPNLHIQHSDLDPITPKNIHRSTSSNSFSILFRHHPPSQAMMSNNDPIGSFFVPVNIGHYISNFISVHLRDVYESTDGLFRGGRGISDPEIVQRSFHAGIYHQIKSCNESLIQGFSSVSQFLNREEMSSTLPHVIAGYNSIPLCKALLHEGIFNIGNVQSSSLNLSPFNLTNSPAFIEPSSSTFSRGNDGFSDDDLSACIRCDGFEESPYILDEFSRDYSIRMFPILGGNSCLRLPSISEYDRLFRSSLKALLENCFPDCLMIDGESPLGLAKRIGNNVAVIEIENRILSYNGDTLK